MMKKPSTSLSREKQTARCVRALSRKRYVYMYIRGRKIHKPAGCIHLTARFRTPSSPLLTSRLKRRHARPSSIHIYIYTRILHKHLYIYKLGRAHILRKRECEKTSSCRIIYTPPAHSSRQESARR